MLKCSRCKQYYIPGYLDCQCRVARAMLAANAQDAYPSKDQATTTPWPDTNTAAAHSAAVHGQAATAHKMPAAAQAKQG
jgi:hypothetical protein